MRRFLSVVAGLALVACIDRAPSSPESDLSVVSVPAGSAPIGSSAHAHDPLVFNTQMRNELESPACPSESKGHAQVKVDADGTIHSIVVINNKGDESVRFGHIHHLNVGAATGPVIWWLSSPIGTDLNITDRHIDIRQTGAFVSNTHFATHEDALAELLANPSDFYVNFHSDNCPGGFARGFLPD